MYNFKYSTNQLIRESIMKAHSATFFSLKVLAARMLRWLPAPLFVPGFQREWSVQVRADSLDGDLSARQKGDRVDVILSDHSALTKTLSVPRSAARKIEDVLDLHLKKTLPAAGNGTIWAYTLGKQGDGKLRVTAKIVKQDELDQLFRAVKSAGMLLRTIRVSHSDGELFLLDRRRKVDRPLRVWLALTISLFLIAAFGWFSQKWKVDRDLKIQVARLTTMKDALTSEAVELKKTEAKFSEEANSALDDASRLAAQSNRLILLMDLTNALPDSTWLSELSVSGGRIRLSGFSSDDVSSLVQQIEAVTGVDNVVLDGPVLFDSTTRQSRFKVAATLSPN